MVSAMLLGISGRRNERSRTRTTAPENRSEAVHEGCLPYVDALEPGADFDDDGSAVAVPRRTPIERVCPAPEPAATSIDEPSWIAPVPAGGGGTFCLFG